MNVLSKIYLAIANEFDRYSVARKALADKNLILCGGDYNWSACTIYGEVIATSNCPIDLAGQLIKH